MAEYEDMENYAPPAMRETLARPGDPAEVARNLARRHPDDFTRTPGMASIEEIAAAYQNECLCGHAYANNCAHYLSHAFADAGYTNILKPLAAIEARCASKRPIRARNMWKWFETVATKRSSRIVKNTGMWAVFQYDEVPGSYWGGHVCIIDTDSIDVDGKFLYYGTGCFPEWSLQSAFKW